MIPFQRKWKQDERLYLASERNSSNIEKAHNKEKRLVKFVSQGIEITCPVTH